MSCSRMQSRSSMSNSGTLSYRDGGMYTVAQQNRGQNHLPITMSKLGSFSYYLSYTLL